MIDLETPDAGDLDALDVLIDSDGWKLVKTRMAGVLEALRSRLERDLPLEETARVRGQIEMLRTILDIPQILRDEIKKEIS